MIAVNKNAFLKIAKFRPQWLIGKQITYNKQIVSILDISMSGDALQLNSNGDIEWVTASSFGDNMVVDVVDFPTDTGIDPFTVLSITKSIESLEKLVGQPDSENSKPLYEIVAALSKEVLHLKLKIEEMEKK